MARITPGLLLPSLETDGKQVVVTTPSSAGFKTWFTAAGDSGSVKGAGQRIRMSWTAEEARGEKSVVLQFSEPIEIHDGQGLIKPVHSWSFDDTISMKAILPSSSYSINTGSLGNCNAVDTGLGFHLIVPAAGNGGHDINLSTAVPVPADNNDGYWDVDYNTGEITPSESPGEAKWNLIDVPITTAFLMKLPLGHNTGVLDVDVYKVEWFHPNWRLEVVVDKQSAGLGEFAGWLLCFRRDVTI